MYKHPNERSGARGENKKVRMGRVAKDTGVFVTRPRVLRAIIPRPGFAPTTD